MAFRNLTNVGKEYLATRLANELPVKFIKAKIGNGSVPLLVNPADTKDLYNFKKEVTIIEAVQEQNSIKLTLQVTNNEILEGFYLKEIGIYVDDNGKEVLYWYCNEDNSQYINAQTDVPLSFEIDIMMEVTNINSTVIEWAGKENWISKNYFDEKVRTFEIPTIAELQSRKNLKVGDIVEVLGYYEAGDGAGHKRIIANEDDGSGVQLKNGLYANILHNGEVNVSWFGAKGDGVTDDTLFIQKAIDTADIINFQDKTYLITVQEKTDVNRPLERSCLLLKNNNTLNLNSSILKINNPKNYTSTCLLRVDSIKNIKIYGGKLIGDRDTNPGTIAGQHGHGIRVSDSQNLIFSHIKIINMWGDGISIDSVVSLNNISSDILIDNCYIDNVRRNGITISSAENVTVDNTTISNINGTAPEACIDIEPNFVDYPARNIKFTNNTLSATSKDKLGFCIGNKAENVVVSNNILEGVNVIHHCENIVISNNVIKNGNSLSIRDSSNINIDSNIFNNVSLTNHDDVYQSIINNNLFNMIDRSAFGISQSNNPSKTTSSVTITNNIINSKKGYLIYGYSIIDSLILKNNYFNSDEISEKYVFLLRSEELILDNNIINFNKLSISESDFLNFINTNSSNMLIKNNSININFTSTDIKCIFTISGINGRENKNANITNNIITSVSDITPFYISSVAPNVSITYNDFRNSTKLSAGKAVDYETDNRLKLNAQMQVQQLNTLYHLEKMKQENVYDDYITYNDEKFAYDKQQEKFEKEKQLAYKEALKENSNLTYEDFLSIQPTNLNLIEEPQPSKPLQDFMKKYL